MIGSLLYALLAFSFPFALACIYLGTALIIMAIGLIYINKGKKSKKALVFILIYMVIGVLCLIPMAVFCALFPIENGAAKNALNNQGWTLWWKQPCWENVKANSLLPSGTNRSAVPGTMTLAAGASADGCYDSGHFDLSQNLNVMEVSNGGDSRDYRVSAGVTGQTVKVYYDIVLDEIENDGTYYTGDVIDQCDEINEAADAYFDPEGFYVASGTTVMDIMEDFTEWAEDEDYFSYNTVNSGGYLSALNGLAEFDGGSLSGWMYTDQGYSLTCSAADYVLTTDNTHIDWFYTTGYYNHF